VTTIAPSTITASSCAIAPSDFSDSTRDRDRDTWTPAKLALVTAALDGAPCVITTEHTGHTLVGVQLLGIGGIPCRDGDFIKVRSTYRDGTDNVTACSVRNLPKALPIIPLPGAGTNAKWRALEHQRKLTGAVGGALRDAHPDWYGTTWCGYRFDGALARCSVQFASQCWDHGRGEGVHYLMGGQQHAAADCPTPVAAEVTFQLRDGQWVETRVAIHDHLPRWFTVRPRP
jgi:hypothetical protein